MRANPPLEKLAAALRVGDARVELDDVVFHLRDQVAIPVSFPAAVSMHGRRLRLYLRVPASATLPPELQPLFERKTPGPVTIEPEDSRDTSGTYFAAYSRLTAALHILLAREAGYTGPLAKSILEGDEVVVISVSPPAAGGC